MAVLMFLGILFILLGAASFILQTGINLPVDLSKAEVLFGYSTAIGSILGGFFLLTKKSNSSSAPSTPSTPKIK